jgi:hypothetical protein
MAAIIQFRRDTAANWTSNNPTMAVGEIGYETDNENYKIGDGSTAWTSLGYGGLGDIHKTLIDAKGDLVVGTAADTAGILAVGSDGQHLVADSSAAGGVSWEANTESVEDIVGAQFVTNGSHSGISATYDDAGDGAIDLNVDDFSITLAGDLSGSTTVTNLADVTLTATIVADATELGTDTTGNYIATVAGTTNEVEVSGSGSETAAVTIGLPSDVTVTTSLTTPLINVSGASIVLEGATADDFETTLTVTDPTADRTITFPNIDGTVVTTGNLSAATEHIEDTVAAQLVTNGTHSGIAATYDDAGDGAIDLNVDDFTITLAGDLGGSATITDLADATLTATIQANSVALGTDTTGDYTASLVAGTGVTLTNNSGETATPTVAIGQAVGASDTPTFGSVTISSAVANATHAATKAYVDNAIAGLDWHEAVNYASAAVLPNTPTYDNGTAGVGATLTTATQVRLVIDGANATTGNRVLVQDQATAAHNGIYDVTAQGVSGSAVWVLTRATDFDGAPTGEIKAGEAVYVLAGSANGGQGFVVTSTSDPHTVGTHDVDFTQFTGTQAFVAGTGVSITGNTVNVGTAGAARIVVNADDIDLATTAVTAAAYGSATAVPGYTVDAYGRLTAAANTTIAIPSTAVTDFTEATQDVVAGQLVTNGTHSGIAATYDDAGDGAIDLNVDDFTITLSGDIGGSVTITDLANATLATTIQADSIALGTDTTGNYLATVTGTANEVEVSGSGSETAAVTVGLPDDVTIGNDLTITADVSAVNATFTGITTLSGTVAGASPLVFEGATADDYETTLAITDPTADRTITLPNVTGTVVTTGNLSAATEHIEDTVGAQVATNGSHTGIDATYDDAGDGAIDLTLTASGASAASYGSATQVPGYTVDTYGRLTAASNTTIAIPSTAVTDFTEATQDVTGAQIVTNGSHTHLTAAYDDAGDGAIDIALNVTAVTAAAYGSATQVPGYTVDAYGRLTAAANTTIAIPSTAVTDFTEAVQDVSGAQLATNGTHTGITATYDDAGDGAIDLNVDDFTITLGGDLTGNVTITDLANATLTATIAADSVALGTDSTGNYIATVAGTANEVDVSGSGSETAAVTIGLPAAVTVTTSLTTPLVNVSGASIVIEGATANDFETTLTVTDPTADRTITFLDETGTVFTTASVQALADGVTGTTQSASDASTKLATTAYVDTGLGALSSDSITDADGDTKIQVEESADEDIIRFDTAGTERMTIAADGTVTITGDLTVNGTETTISSTTITVDDKNIEIGSVDTPTDTTADGGGLTLKGATDKTWNWVNSTDAWTSSEHVDLASGKAFYVAGVSVLNATTLGSNVVASSLTSVGTIASLAATDLTVSGIATFSGTIAGASPLVFEGATADDYETTFAITDPTADRTITFQDATGTVAFLASPTFTGTPVAPTAAADTNTTQIATTAFVMTEIGDYLTTSTASSTYAPLASPSLTGVPVAPTAAADTNTTQLATTAFVMTEIGDYLTTSTATSTYAPLASPALTGIPTSTTAAADTNTTQIATTAYVQTELGALSSDSVTDADGDTKIQVEESADEDIIRFDTAGTERMTISATGVVATVGDLTIGGSITDGATATTQTQSDASTKLATTAYVDTGLGALTSGSIIDADADTKIQVEESADEDIIRFDIGGSELGSMGSYGFYINGRVVSVDAFNAQTGTSYTPVISDRGLIVTMNNASAQTLTIPPNSSVAFVIGNSFQVIGLGAGEVTMVAGSGVTLRATPGLKLRAQYSSVTCIKIATDEWVLVGDLEA